MNISSNGKLKTDKLTKKEIVFFGMGDLFGGGGGALVNGILLTYLVLMGLEPWMGGLIVGLARIWDAVIDPVLGVFSDNTRTKWGRRRPFIFFGGLFIPLALLWLFAPLYAMNSVWLKFFIYLFGYLFYNTVSSVVTLTYNAMSSEVSCDYKERNTVNTVRLVFSMLAGGVTALAPVELMGAYLNQSISIGTVYLIIVVGFGLFFTIPVLLSAIYSKERVTLPEEKSTFTIKSFLTPFRVKAFWYILGMYFFAYACTDIITANLIFFVKYALDASASATIMLLLIVGITALVAPLMYIAMRKGVAKPLLYRLGIPFYIVGALALSLYQGANALIIYLFCGIIGLGASSMMFPWIIFPDVMDVAELKLGNRPTGSFSGVMSFIKTAGSGIAVALVGAVLSLTGFQKPETDPITGSIIREFTQPQSALWGLRLVIIIPVIIMMSAAFYCALKLKLNQKRVDVLKTLIEHKQQDIPIEGELLAEYQSIEKDLF
ncbi:MAG: MFS transporter [Clostridia bacterium]